MTLRDYLLDLNGEFLKAWLRWCGVPIKGLTRKDQFATAIADELNTNLAGVIARLDEAERLYLGECAHRNRPPSAREFTARYAIPCPDPDPGLYFQRDHVARLAPFVHTVRRGERVTSGLVAELMEPLRKLLPPPPAPSVRTTSALPASELVAHNQHGGQDIHPVLVYESERNAPLELGRMLRFVLGGKVQITASSNRPTDSTTRLVGGALVTPDYNLERPKSEPRLAFDRGSYTPAGPVRAHAWPVLLQQCGWARPRGSRLELTDAGQAMLARFDPAGFRQGVAAYLHDDAFDELNRIPHIRGQSGKARRLLTAPSHRKHAIARVLARLPVGEWMRFSECCRFLEACAEPWQVLEHEVPVLHFFGPEFGHITDNTGLGRQFLRALCLESLATLGLLDVAFTWPHRLWPDLRSSMHGDLSFCSRYDGLLYVRLNPLGAWGLEAADRYVSPIQEAPRSLRVLPNHDLVFPNAPPNPADQATLELLAVPAGDRVWKLDAGRMLSHLEAGGGLVELREFLEANAAGGLPDNVQTFLDELAGRVAACRGHQEAVLIEWADEPLAQTIATSTGLRTLCHHAGGNRVVVPAGKLAAFRNALKRLGYVLPPRPRASPPTPAEAAPPAHPGPD